MGFFKDLDIQIQDMQEENDTLQFVLKALKDSKKKSDQYIYEITKQTIRHNEESINLMLSIINDNEKDTGAYKN
jgi:sugar-specific transcriptional regulator TrmB